MTPSDERKSEVTFPAPSCHLEVSAPAAGEAVATKTVCNEVSGGESVDTTVLSTESLHSSVLSTTSADLVEKTLEIEGDVLNKKDDERDVWKPEEATKGVPEITQSFVSDGLGSFKSVSGKTDDIGSGTGSLSRLAGLGRAARRQLTVVLDEFWGQLFDLHGQATREAKSKKLDLLLCLDPRVDPIPPFAFLKLDSRNDFNAHIPSVGARGPDSLINSNLYSPKQQVAACSMDAAYGVQKESSSMWSTNMQLLDACVRSSYHNTLDSGERRYSSMRIPASFSGYDQQPATVHGYEIASYLNRIAKLRGSDYLNGQVESPSQLSMSSVTSNYVESSARAVVQKPQSAVAVSSRAPPGFGNVPVSRNNSMQPVNTCSDLCSPENAESKDGSANVKKYYSLPNISGCYVPCKDFSQSDRTAQWDNSVGHGQSASTSLYEQTYMTGSPRVSRLLRVDEQSSKVCSNAFSLQFSANSGTGSLWSRQPFEQFCVAGKPGSVSSNPGTLQISSTQEGTSTVDSEAKLLQSFRSCIVKLLKLEGSEWLLRQDDGADEDLIDHIAAREKFLYEAETREISRLTNIGESQFSSDRKPGSAPKPDEADYTSSLVMSVPHCGEGCIWRVDLIVSFGVWCIHRILELSLMESRPELWGKYTFVLNRLQGIINLAFFKSRSPMTPCFCLHIPIGGQQRSSPPISNGSLPPQAKQGRGKCTTAAMLLEMIRDVEMAISCRKGRTGTAAGDVAFPKGKENLASVLKRYKRRLSNKPVGSQDARPGLRKVS